MARKNKHPITLEYGLERFLEDNQSAKWKPTHNGNTLFSVYQTVKNKLAFIQKEVVTGALNESASTIIQHNNQIIESTEIDNTVHDTTANTNQEPFTANDLIYLNDHGPDHAAMVIQRANAILSCVKDDYVTELEAFLLLCAIQAHDIGNITGRSGHEKKIREIFDKYCETDIPDNYERSLIISIATAHGGTIAPNNKNTMLYVQELDHVLEAEVRSRFLASVLRFADELADDFTRANRIAKDFGIIPGQSGIFHAYSNALKSVTIKEDHEHKGFRVELHYYLETADIEKNYATADPPKYLLDEIYKRTTKMERERMYCMKFMRPHVEIGSIFVSIKMNVPELFKINKKLDDIKYTLQDIYYPNSLSASDMTENELKSGAELYSMYCEMMGGRS